MDEGVHHYELRQVTYGNGGEPTEFKFDRPPDWRTMSMICTLCGGKYAVMDLADHVNSEHGTELDDLTKWQIPELTRTEDETFMAALKADQGPRQWVDRGAELEAGRKVLAAEISVWCPRCQESLTTPVLLEPLTEVDSEGRMTYKVHAESEIHRCLGHRSAT